MIPRGIPIKDAKTEFETHPVITDAKTILLSNQIKLPSRIKSINPIQKYLHIIESLASTL